MDNPKLYSKSNLVQADLTKDILKTYLKHVKWNAEGGDAILDIGCGTGNVTCEVLLPMLPSSVKSVIGVDVNHKMVDTATEIYANHPKVEFKLLNIGEEIPDNFKGKFEHVFSFFCLHWIKDQSLVMKNIFSLLKPDGTTLFWFVLSCGQVHKNYIDMQKDARWQKYMEDITEVLPPYMNDTDPEAALRKNIETAGLKVQVCENLSKEFIFYDDQSLKDFLESVNPFVKRMEGKEKEEYMEFYVQKVKQYDPKNTKNGPTTLYFNVLAACAYKPK